MRVGSPAWTSFLPLSSWPAEENIVLYGISYFLRRGGEWLQANLKLILEGLGDINRDVLGREHVNLTSDDHKQIAFIGNEKTKTPSLKSVGVKREGEL